MLRLPGPFEIKNLDLGERLEYKFGAPQQTKVWKTSVTVSLDIAAPLGCSAGGRSDGHCG